MSDKLDSSWYTKIVIEDDGRFIGVRTNGTRELIGKWEWQGSLLRVTYTAARIATERTSGVQMNSWDYYPVIYADAHELVMAPGISVGGRWRFTR